MNIGQERNFSSMGTINKKILSSFKSVQARCSCNYQLICPFLRNIVNQYFQYIKFQMEKISSSHSSAPKNYVTSKSVSSAESQSGIESKLQYKQDQNEESQELREWRQQTQCAVVKISAWHRERDQINGSILNKQFTYLSQTESLTIANLLYILQTLLLSLEILTQQIGYFRITEKMIGIDKAGKCKFWVNQNLAKNSFQYPLQNHAENQGQMVTNIIQILYDLLHESQDQTIERQFLEEAALGVESFISFKDLIWKFSYANSILIPPYFLCFQKDGVSSSVFQESNKVLSSEEDFETRRQNSKKSFDQEQKCQNISMKFVNKKQLVWKHQRGKKVQFLEKNIQFSRSTPTSSNQKVSTEQQQQPNIFEGGSNFSNFAFIGNNRSQKSSQKSKFSFKNCFLKMNERTNQFEKFQEFQQDVKILKNQSQGFFVSQISQKKRKTFTQISYTSARPQSKPKCKTFLVKQGQNEQGNFLQKLTKQQKKQKMKEFIKEKLNKNQNNKKIVHLQEIHTVKSIGDFTESDKRIQLDENNPSIQCLEMLGSMGRRIDKSFMYIQISRQLSANGFQL